LRYCVGPCRRKRKKTDLPKKVNHRGGLANQKGCAQCALYGVEIQNKVVQRGFPRVGNMPERGSRPQKGWKYHGRTETTVRRGDRAKRPIQLEITKRQMKDMRESAGEKLRRGAREDSENVREPPETINQSTRERGRRGSTDGQS